MESMNVITGNNKVNLRGLWSLWQHQHQDSHLCEGTVKILQLIVPKTALLGFVKTFSSVYYFLISGLLYYQKLKNSLFRKLSSHLGTFQSELISLPIILKHD